jgi:hypothetical protein
MQKLARQPGFFRTGVIGSVLFGFVLALILSASPRLHELVHGDHDAAGHQCLVATLQGGGCNDVEPGAPTIAVFLASILVLVPIGDLAWVESIFSIGCVFEHAPPFISC